MKILLANKFHYPRGGDCICTLNLADLLVQHGHEVAHFAMQYPDNLPTQWDKYFPSEVKFSPGLGMIEAFLRPFGTKEVKRKFNKLLDDFQPDVVHLHNIHTQLSPAIAEIAHRQGIKVVWTLHDYKLLCPRYDCLRNDIQVCEECFRNKKAVLAYNCMKNSKLASMLAYREAMKWTREKLEKYTDAFICPSQFMNDKMQQGEFSPNKLVTLCNFIDIEKTKRDSYDKEDYYCYVGRLSREKGVKTLIEVANELSYKLKIIGGGLLQKELEAQVKHSNIEFVGFKHWDEIKELVGKARFVVIPSEWYENNPLSVIESQCIGTPVLGANIGGIPELIEEGTGMLFEPRNVEELKTKIEAMFSTSFDYKTIAHTAQQRFSSNKYYQQIIEIYKS